jgi:hypothetical protein
MRSIIGGRTKITRDEADLNGNNVLVHITNNKDEWGQDGKLRFHIETINLTTNLTNPRTPQFNGEMPFDLA